MRHLWLLPCLSLLTIVTWPDEHGRGGVLFSEWELRRMTSATPYPAPARYQLASLGTDLPVMEAGAEQPEAVVKGLPDLPGSFNSADEEEEKAEAQTVPLRAPAPPVAIEDMCVAMASAAQLSDLPVGFFARLIWQESKFGQWVVSRAGAQGVAQFMPKTAAWIGLADPFDPITSFPASARFLKMLYEQFGNLGLAAAAYNGGPGRLQNWLAGKGPLPEETRNYVRIITGHEVDKWLSEREIEVSFHLPTKAPCEGLAGLSRQVTPTKLAVTVEPAIVKLIETARAEAAKKAARAALNARKLAAKKKAQRAKVAGTASAKTAAKKAGRPLKLATN
jgi:hypothetical protein